ncbi:GPW/gp25 family protein [Pseudorhodoferax sp.]|uniref:GPW/gp25 family protein n=1 Tax=Pseudorhodoferax sp. TaxID=1993553 RepID=UPI0039E4BCED
MDSLPAPFLGVGWAFPVARAPAGEDGAGALALAHYEDSVRQGMLLVLSTAPGERLMRPDFGCAIHELLFAPNDATTRGMAESAVAEALRRWEPRIELLRVAAVSRGDPKDVLEISVDYRVARTDSRFNLVFPFYLGRPLR